MKSFIVLFLTFFFSWVYALAQVTGYMGKRSIVFFSAQGMPLKEYFFTKEKPLDLNLRYSLGLEYVLSKSLSIGATLEGTNDIIFLKKYTTTSNIGESYFNTPAEYKSAANYYGLSYGLNLKYYLFKSSGSIAPFGRFIILEYLRNNIDITDDGRYYTSEKRDLNSIDASTLILGIGSQKILFDRLVVGAYVKLGMNTYGLKYFNKKQRIYYDEITLVGTSKMFSDYLINFGLTFGFLAF